jgi:hypothetical protein
MRKGFDSLCGMVTERLARNPLSGDIFLFVSRDRIRELAGTVGKPASEMRDLVSQNLRQLLADTRVLSSGSLGSR